MAIDEGKQLTCKHCTYSWFYKGKKQKGFYASCPMCYFKVKVLAIMLLLALCLFTPAYADSLNVGIELSNSSLRLSYNNQTFVLDNIPVNTSWAIQYNGSNITIINASYSCSADIIKQAVGEVCKPIADVQSCSSSLMNMTISYNDNNAKLTTCTDLLSQAKLITANTENEMRLAEAKWIDQQKTYIMAMGICLFCMLLISVNIFQRKMKTGGISH